MPSFDDYMNKLKRLPQAPYVPEARMQRWLKTVLQRDPDRVDWHIERLSGFGGSEIGTLVLGRRGEKGKFSTARDIMLQKLLIYPPLDPTHEMVMGIIGEPLVRHRFLRYCQGQRRQDIVKRYQGHLHSEYPWMRVTPDDVVSLALFDDKIEDVVIDYKLPSENTMDEYRDEEAIDFEYSCQLTQGMLIGQDLGVNTHNSILVNLDTKQPDTGYINARLFPFNHDLANEIIEAGNYYYTMLINGLVPEADERPYIDFSDNQELQALLEKLPADVLLADKYKGRVEAAKEQIKLLVGDDVKVTSKVSGALLDMTVRKGLNKERLIDMAYENELDLANYSVTKQETDMNRLLADLREKLGDEAVDTLYDQSFSMAAPKAKKDPRTEHVRRLRERLGEISESLDGYANELTETIKQTMNDEAVEPTQEKTPKAVGLGVLNSAMDMVFDSSEAANQEKMSNKKPAMSRSL